MKVSFDSSNFFPSHTSNVDIYCSIDVKHDDNQITVDIFTDSAILMSPAAHFTQGDYVLFAILNGGDYDEVFQSILITLQPNLYDL